MCGRFTAWAIARNWRDYGLTFESTVIPAPRYNAAPGQLQTVVAASTDEVGSLAIREMRWGLVPHWARDEKIGYRLVNARAETVASLPSFREAFRRRRCLVPADGFYEWQTQAGHKQPYRFVPVVTAAMCFAGLWERWLPPLASEAVETFTIIVCPASSDVEAVHDRMPVILPVEAYAQWMSPDSSMAQLQQLLVPAPAGTLRRYPVSPAVGNVRNSGPELVAEWHASGSPPGGLFED